MNFAFKTLFWRDLQDGRGVSHGDHLPLHKYIKNTSTCGTAPTGHLLNAGRRPQTSQKARKFPLTWVGQKKKEKAETKEKGWDLYLWEGAVEEEKFPHTRKPLHWWRQGVVGVKFQSHGGESSNKGVEGKVERFPHREWCQPALTSLRGLSAHLVGWVVSGS